MRKAMMALLFLAAAGRLPQEPGDALDTGGGGIARQYRVHAEEALAHEHVTEALALTNKALALYPNDIAARFTRGRAYLAGAQYDAALADFGQVVAAHPEFAFAFEYRGLAYLRARQATQAMADFNQALMAPRYMTDKRTSTIFGYRSLALQLLGRNTEAVQDFAHSQALLARHLDDYDQLAAYCYTATVIGLLDTAQIACDESITRKSRNIRGYEARGLLALKQGKLDNAIADDTQSLYYRDDNAFALYGRGLAKRAKGDAAGGASDMNAARQIEPDIAGIMARLGAVTPVAKGRHAPT